MQRTRFTFAKEDTSVGAGHLLPFYWVPEHDDEASVRLQGVDKVLDKKGRLPLCGVIVEIHPGVVIPHGGRTGFSCKTRQHKMQSGKVRTEDVHIFWLVCSGLLRLRLTSPSRLIEKLESADGSADSPPCIQLANLIHGALFKLF